MSLEFMTADELRTMAQAHSSNCAADAKAASVAKERGEYRIAESFVTCAASELDLALLYARELKRRQRSRNLSSN